MSSSPPSNLKETASPPPPPPPPQNPLTKASPFVLKLKTTPPDTLFQENHPQNPNTPAPTGPYFFYGSLLDPYMLVEILGLDNEPELRPAQLRGYDCKLWGQYPALVQGHADNLVVGAAYDVQTVEDAEKLTAYETRNYMPVLCSIEYTDGKPPTQQLGHAFLYVGNVRDLSEGTFDLKIWLQRMERLDQWEAKKATGA